MSIRLSVYLPSDLSLFISIHQSLYIISIIYTRCIQYVSWHFCTGIWNCRRLLKIQYVIAIHLMRWLTNIYDFRFKWTATAAIRIHPTKPDCHSWWISEMQSGREEERYAIKFFFKFGKYATETNWILHIAFGASCMNRASVLEWHEIQWRLGSLWGMMRGVRGVRKSIHQSWSAKGLGLLCWGFKGVQEEIPSKRSALFKSGQWHFHQDNTPVHNSILVTHYLTKMDIKTVPQLPDSPDLAPCDFWLFPKLTGCRYETIKEMKEAVMKVTDTLTQSTSMGPSRSCWNVKRSALKPEEITSKGTRVSCVYYE